MALIGQRFPQDSTAEALDDALLCVLSRRDLERLIMDNPKVGGRSSSNSARGSWRSS
jgi:CRP-like cAMP-binding protein